MTQSGRGCKNLLSLFGVSSRRGRNFMTETVRRVTGGCMCGAVRYECEGGPMTVAYCHCEDCRHHTGAPVVVWVAYDSDRVRYTNGTPKIYESSPGIGRAFCGDCGTPMTWQAESVRFPGKHITEFHIGTLDDPSVHVPDRHWFDSKRIAWFNTADNLPRYSRLDGEGTEPIHIGPKKD